MRDEFRELVPGDAILHRELQVVRQLVRAVLRNEGRDGDEASVALRETRALPDLAEEHPLRDVVERRSDIGVRAARDRGIVRHVRSAPWWKGPVLCVADLLEPI